MSPEQWKEALEAVQNATDAQVVEALEADRVEPFRKANAARRILSAHCARAEAIQYGAIEMRRQEFVTVLKIHAALEGVDL